MAGIAPCCLDEKKGSLHDELCYQLTKNAVIIAILLLYLSNVLVPKSRRREMQRLSSFFKCVSAPRVANIRFPYRAKLVL